MELEVIPIVPTGNTEKIVFKRLQGAGTPMNLTNPQRVRPGNGSPGDGLAVFAGVGAGHRRNPVRGVGVP